MKVVELLPVIKEDQKISLITNNPSIEWDSYDGYRDDIPFKYMNAEVEYIEISDNVLEIKTNYQDAGRGYDY